MRFSQRLWQNQAALSGSLVLLLFLTGNHLASGQELIKKDFAVSPLPGGLDQIPVFNSNSPELIQTEGILLSTFAPETMSKPEAHLNYPLEGRFDIFAHHVTKSSEENPRTLYLGIIIQNPGREKVHVNVLAGASYLSQPDAPFIKLRTIESNPDGKIFSGPGDRVTDDLLREKRQTDLKKSFVLSPGQYAMVVNLPIPVKTLTPHLNGRSTLIHLKSNGKVYVASLAMLAPKDENTDERAPSIEEWIRLLKVSSLAGPRDKAPTLPDSKDRVIYGRVAGVSLGSSWTACLTDPPTAEASPNESLETQPQLSVPREGESIAYPISSLQNGRFGTGQVQSAKLVARYPDTAYLANGNYGVQYKITLPLVNTGEETRRISISLQNPIKNDSDNRSLSFFNQPPERVHFRGTVLLKYKDDEGNLHKDYLHLVAKNGEELPPLIEISLKPGSRRVVDLDFLYPPDATPPQTLCITAAD